MAAELGAKVKIVGANVDEGPEAAAATGIASIPTLVFFKDGREVHRIEGYVKKPELIAQIQKHLGVAPQND